MPKYDFSDFDDKKSKYDFSDFDGKSGESESSNGGFSLEGLARGTLKALPVAGAMFGGAAGTVLGVPSGPGAIATGVAGAGLGMAAGESLKNIGEHYLGDEKTREEIYAGPTKAA